MVLGLIVVGYFSWTKNKATLLITILMTAIFGLLFVSGQQAGTEYARVTPIIFVDYGKAGDFMLPFSSWTSTYLLKPNFADLFGKIGSAFSFILSAFLIMLAKDTLGTASSLVALGKQSGDMTENDENHHRAEKAMQVVGFNRIVAGLVGGVPADIAPEASIAIEADGRTSVTPFIYAIGCVVLLFGFNFFAMIPAIAVAPVLIVIGAGMLRGIGKIHWKDPIEAIPAAVMMFVAAITFNLFIAVTLGMAINMIIRVAIWKFDDTPAGFWLLGSLSLASLIFFYIGILR
jgi:AGZA family xanthine/uracil permease-like MFS transporter